ncbi:hypothetical protein D0Z07_6433 [Hyphodiscus hymeniophilus]|uniref:Uncharacterized protein n=1 Tax=Hyphodiscus hymeniophilus TaxID=353542 RepID=A0A9P7AUF7_9HELO|nr:hypothetical protein D0Z07_6433 [Hyphodiscus hymeniophilus]
MREIRKETPTARYTIYEGIYNGLEALLKATNLEGPPKNRVGSKSLLALCLRTVPRYITHEEELFITHMEVTKSKSAINNRDISTEIYDDLEAFGCNGKGWKHFRNIVRSHGIQLLSDAIRVGSLDAEFIGILITQCIHTRAVGEAEILLSTLLSTTKFPAPKSVFNRFDDDPAMRPLSMLWKFVEITGNYSFQYREMSALISTGILPLSWLATKELGPFWTKAIQALPNGSNDTDALQFMDTVLPLLAQSGPSACGNDRSINGDGLMLDAVKQTFSSLLTTLSSIVLLSGEADNHVLGRSASAKRIEYDHFVALARSCLMQWELYCNHNTQGTLLVIANLILRDNDHHSPESELDLMRTLFNHLHHMGKETSILPSYHEIVSFICSIARCCGRGASSSGFEYLENLHQKLESLIRESDAEGGNLVREILADSALAFAQEIPDRNYLDYADAMEAKVHRMETNRRVSLTPGHPVDNSRTGFRWEEGISEWVMATPHISTRKCHDSMKFPRAHQSECETPFRPTNQRKFKKPTLPNARTHGLQSLVPISTTACQSKSFESSPISRSPTLGSDDDDDAVNGPAENERIRHDKAGGSLSRHYPQVNTPESSDSSGDELASDSTDQDQSDDEGPGEELLPSSPRSKSLSDFERTSSPQSEKSLTDASFASVSTTNSLRSKELRSGRRHIDRVPRLSRRVLRRSLQWQMFDDDGSDDELSFISVSSEGFSTLQDITTNVGARIRRHQQTKPEPDPKSVRQFNDSLLGDSEDELCI